MNKKKSVNNLGSELALESLPDVMDGASMGIENYVTRKDVSL